MTNSTPVSAISHLDLNRYMGKWYEICRLPLKWEEEAATDITARYSLKEAGGVIVDNRCFDTNGKPKQSIGAATPVGGSTSRLKVMFLPEFLRWLPFTQGDYWVLKIDPEYQFSLVGTPDRNNLWLLAREPRIQAEIRDAYLGEAQRQGFDLSAIITPRHTGLEVTDALVG